MGIRPKDAPMSWNEVQWWASYRGIVPNMQKRIAIFEARLVGIQAGKSPAQVYLNDWDNFKNKEWLDSQKAELEELEKLKAEENGKDS